MRHSRGNQVSAWAKALCWAASAGFEGWDDCAGLLLNEVEVRGSLSSLLCALRHLSQFGPKDLSAPRWRSKQSYGEEQVERLPPRLRSLLTLRYGGSRGGNGGLEAGGNGGLEAILRDAAGLSRVRGGGRVSQDADAAADAAGDDGGGAVPPYARLGFEPSWAGTAEEVGLIHAELVAQSVARGELRIAVDTEWMDGEIGSEGTDGEIGSEGMDGEIGSEGTDGEIGSEGTDGEIGSQRAEASKAAVGDPKGESTKLADASKGELTKLADGPKDERSGHVRIGHVRSGHDVRSRDVGSRDVGSRDERSRDERSRRGAHRPAVVAVVQLAIEGHAWVIDALGEGRAALSELIIWMLGSSSVLVLGFAFAGDLVVLRPLCGVVEAPRLVDLQVLGRRPGEDTPSLQKVCARTIGRRLDKTQQCSKWSRRPLEREQFLYAALDAHILLDVHEALVLAAC